MRPGRKRPGRPQLPARSLRACAPAPGSEAGTSLASSPGRRPARLRGRRSQRLDADSAGTGGRPSAAHANLVIDISVPFELWSRKGGAGAPAGAGTPTPFHKRRTTGRGGAWGAIWWGPHPKDGPRLLATQATPWPAGGPPRAACAKPPALYGKAKPIRRIQLRAIRNCRTSRRSCNSRRPTSDTAVSGYQLTGRSRPESDRPSGFGVVGSGWSGARAGGRQIPQSK